MKIFYLGQNVYSRLFCEKAGLFSYACQHDPYDTDDNEMLVGTNTTSSSSASSTTCCSAQWLLLANTMNGLSVLIYLFFFLAGLLFDTIGGQYAAIYGCYINATGFLVLAGLFSTLHGGNSLAPVLETGLFCVGVILVDAGSIMTNISFYGFLWHLPSHQALILSLANCCLNVAALIPLVLRYVMEQYFDETTTTASSSLATVMGGYGILILVLITPLCWYTVPSVEQYRSQAMAVLGVPIPRHAIKGGFKGVIQQTKAAGNILRVHAHLHYYSMLACLFTWLVGFIYMTMADPLGSEIFTTHPNISRNAAAHHPNPTETNNSNSNNTNNDAVDTAGEQFGTLFNQMNALLGFFVGPVIGVIIDRISKPATGLQYLVWSMMLTLGVIGGTCRVPNWSFQTIAVSSAILCQIVTMLFINRVREFDAIVGV